MLQPFRAPSQHRQEAGRELAHRLVAYKGQPKVVVLSVSRGGVPVAAGIADVLEAPLDVFFIRRVKVPGYEAISMGTVARGVHLPDKNVIEHAGISLQAFFAASSAEQEQLDRREVFLRSGRPAQAIMGRTIILVDDGLTAESDLPAAIEAVHRHGATKVVVAVPVTTLEARDKLSKQVDEFVSLHAIDAASRLDVWYEGATGVDEENVRVALGQAALRVAMYLHREVT
jgi:putative phosphoribosyl transferase